MHANPQLQQGAGVSHPMDQQDPSLPLAIDGFLLGLLRTDAERARLLDIEATLEAHMADPHPSNVRLEFPPCSSYQRLIIHRLAQHFRMDHAVLSRADWNPTMKTVVVFKKEYSRMPNERFADMDIPTGSLEPLNAVHDANGVLANDGAMIDDVKIMRRNGAGGAANAAQNGVASGGGGIGGSRGSGEKKEMTYEEREDAYNKARDRIFAGEGSDSSGSTPPASAMNGGYGGSGNGQGGYGGYGGGGYGGGGALAYNPSASRNFAQPIADPAQLAGMPGMGGVAPSFRPLPVGGVPGSSSYPPAPAYQAYAQYTGTDGAPFPTGSDGMGYYGGGTDGNAAGVGWPRRGGGVQRGGGQQPGGRGGGGYRGRGGGNYNSGVPRGRGSSGGSAPAFVPAAAAGVIDAPAFTPTTTREPSLPVNGGPNNVNAKQAHPTLPIPVPEGLPKDTEITANGVYVFSTAPAINGSTAGDGSGGIGDQSTAAGKGGTGGGGGGDKGTTGTHPDSAAAAAAADNAAAAGGKGGKAAQVAAPLGPDGRPHPHGRPPPKTTQTSPPIFAIGHADLDHFPGLGGGGAPTQAAAAAVGSNDEVAPPLSSTPSQDSAQGGAAQGGAAAASRKAKAAAAWAAGAPKIIARPPPSHANSTSTTGTTGTPDTHSSAGVSDSADGDFKSAGESASIQQQQVQNQQVQNQQAAAALALMHAQQQYAAANGFFMQQQQQGGQQYNGGGGGGQFGFSGQMAGGQMAGGGNGAPTFVPSSMAGGAGQQGQQPPLYHQNGRQPPVQYAGGDEYGDARMYGAMQPQLQQQQQQQQQQAYHGGGGRGGGQQGQQYGENRSRGGGGRGDGNGGRGRGQYFNYTDSNGSGNGRGGGRGGDRGGYQPGRSNGRGSGAGRGEGYLGGGDGGRGGGSKPEQPSGNSDSAAQQS